MNSHYLSTSRSNPQFYTFSQRFERGASCDSFSSLDPQWKAQAQQAAWLDFWQREGHEFLEQKWHEQHPEYKQEIELATPEERTAWQELWERHACDQSAHFWHIFSCVFENYERDLSNGLQGVGQTLDEINENLSLLDIRQSDDSAASAESGGEDEQYLTANDDPELLDEEQQLRLLGLPTSFGVPGIARKRRKPRQQPASESESDNDPNLVIMPDDKDELLHGVQSRVIKKKKKPQKNSKVPQFMRDDILLRKYWFRRFSLFSRFDQGILLDRESWFSVTPEKIAKQTARRLASDVVVDAFCGCGGNAIQFANTCSRVIAIDIDANKLAMAKQNARIYGVSHKIEFIHADFLQFARATRLRPDVVFLSPPWGGPDYLKQATFDIEQHLLPLGATRLMQHARRLTDNIGFFLPRNSNIQQVIALSHIGQQCEVEHNYLDTRLVAITAYYGDSLLKSPRPDNEP
ncbi:trimethylguanosine synthase [Drosophila montana]|uniref:trimethylguanosine synthase n=1 Tax=Drosophila montana TaxID=40370 RepID=UPI00313D6ACD